MNSAAQYKVVYLGSHARRAYAGEHSTLERASVELRSLKRTGRGQHRASSV